MSVDNEDFNFAFDRVIDLGRYENRGEGRVAPVSGVEGGLADQTMHAGLGTKPAVDVLPGDVHGRALNAGDLTGRRFDNFGFETM